MEGLASYFQHNYVEANKRLTCKAYMFCAAVIGINDPRSSDISFVIKHCRNNKGKFNWTELMAKHDMEQYIFRLKFGIRSIDNLRKLRLLLKMDLNIRDMIGNKSNEFVTGEFVKSIYLHWKNDSGLIMDILMLMYEENNNDASKDNCNQEEKEKEKDNGKNGMNPKEMLKFIRKYIPLRENATLYQHIFLEAINRAGININDPNCDYVKDIAPILLNLVSKKEIDEYASNYIGEAEYDEDDDERNAELIDQRNAANVKTAFFQQLKSIIWGNDKKAVVNLHDLLTARYDILELVMGDKEKELNDILENEIVCNERGQGLWTSYDVKDIYGRNILWYLALGGQKDNYNTIKTLYPNFNELNRDVDGLSTFNAAVYGESFSIASSIFDTIISSKYNMDNSKSIVDVLIHRNGKPMYFKNSNKAKNFLRNMYNNNKLKLKPFEDDGVLLMSVQ